MRVLFLTHRLPYAPNRGDRLRTYHLLKALAGRAQVDLVSLVHDDEEAAHAEDLRGLVESVSVGRGPGWTRIAWRSPGILGGRPLTHLLMDSPGIRRAIRERARAAPPDVVFAYCTGVAPYAEMPPLTGVPFVLDMVDVDSAKWAELAGSAAPPRRWAYLYEAIALARYEAAIVRRAFATIVVNDRERRTLAALAPGARVEVIGNGVDRAYFAPPSPPSPDPVVVFSGVFNYGPNEEGAEWMATKVWPAVRTARPLARLTLVGANPTPLVRRLAENDPTIAVTGSVDDVRPYLWNASVAVAPIVIARGVQNKVLEAVASGLPSVVRSAVAEGLPRELAPAYRVADDPQDFARLVLSLLDESPTRRRTIASSADLSGLGWPERLRPAVDLLFEAASTAGTIASRG